MSDTTTPAKPPVLSTANVTAAPVLTVAGVGFAATAIGQVLSNAQTPTNAAGWIMLALQGFAAIATIFGRA